MLKLFFLKNNQNFLIFEEKKQNLLNKKLFKKPCLRYFVFFWFLSFFSQLVLFYYFFQIQIQFHSQKAYPFCSFFKFQTPPCVNSWKTLKNPCFRKFRHKRVWNLFSHKKYPSIERQLVPLQTCLFSISKAIINFVCK